MQNEPNFSTGELLRRAMRRWVTGVAIVTSHFDGDSHGMTVNSFNSISLDPPMVTVTMNNDARTCLMVLESNVFAVTVLSQAQQPLAELFAGRMDNHGDRMQGLDLFTLTTGAPLIHGGLAFVDCRVVYSYPMAHATLFIGEVQAARVGDPELVDQVSGTPEFSPLVYINREFTRLR